MQYWSFAGVADDAHRDAIRRLPVSYDLTVIPLRPMGWERPKTFGHVHVSPTAPDAGFPELYEVLEGHAGFLVQDLRAGPRATFSALIEASPGDTVIIPPLLHHVTINLGDVPLVVADVVCRASDDDYGQLRAAHGMAHYIGTDLQAIQNPRYAAVPPLTRVAAGRWSARQYLPVYATLTNDPAALSWLCSPDEFASEFPALWQQITLGVEPQ